MLKYWTVGRSLMIYTGSVHNLTSRLHPLSVLQNRPVMKSALNTLLLAVAQLQAAEALNNGIGLKPHMGWSSWVREPAPLGKTSPYLHDASERRPV